MGVAALKLAGVVNKVGVAVKFFRARFARGLFSTLLDEILDTPLYALCFSLFAVARSSKSSVHNMHVSFDLIKRHMSHFLVTVHSIQRNADSLKTTFYRNTSAMIYSSMLVKPSGPPIGGL